MQIEVYILLIINVGEGLKRRKASNYLKTFPIIGKTDFNRLLAEISRPRINQNTVLKPHDGKQKESPNT